MKSNFYPINFEFQEFDIQRVKYEDGLLAQLRQKHNTTHSFFRRGDYIYISPGVENAATLGETVRLSINDNHEVVSSLIKHIFFRTVKDAQPDLQPVFYPFRFAARKTSFDLAYQNLPESLRNMLTFKRITEVQFRDYTDTDKNVTFGAIINHSYKWNLNLDCGELNRTNFDLIGKEVTGFIVPEYSDGVVAPEISFLGRIQSINNNNASVDTNEGLINYSLESLHLRNSFDNIFAFLTHRLDSLRADKIIRSIKAAESNKLKLSTVMEEIESMSKWLASLDYRNYDSFRFSITLNNIVSVPSGFSLEEPGLIFDISRTRINSKPSIGLNMFGPYSRSIGFSKNSPRILVIFHQQNTSIFTEFLAKLRDGISDHSWFNNGMVKKYHLTAISYHIEEITNYSVDEYLRAIDKGIQKEGAPFDLAIIETCDEFRRLSNKNNPYFRVKASLLMQGTAVQSIKAETARNPTYTIDGIALQMYAKLGGTPWTIPVDQSVDKELVIGIGSAILSKNSYAGSAQARFVGISTFFAADGKYLANSRTQNVPYENYFDELLRNLKDMIDRLSNEYNWNEQDRIRLIFHIFKPIKNLEADVVSSLISQYPQYDIRFAFITLSERHPYILYDEKQSTNGKGANVPPRGYAIKLGDQACLVHILGKNEIRNATHGAPTPILVRIHSHSTFRDLQYIIQQIFKFSRLSFRSFGPSYAPVTLMYANLLTRQLKDLRGLQDWNSNVAHAQLREKKWFL